MSNEEIILRRLHNCTFLPGSWTKRFVMECKQPFSPLQIWHIHKIGFIYRKQIGNLKLTAVSQKFLSETPEPPISRKQAEKILRKAKKEKPEEPPQPIEQPKLF